MTWDGVATDLRQAARALRRSRSLSAVVVATLGLALAASVALFSVLDAVLVEPLPHRDPDRIAFLSHSQTSMAVACSTPTFLDYRRDARSFSSLSATRPADFNVEGDGEPERVRGLFVSADFFETLGVAAARGRTFLPGEDEPGRERVLVISHRLWQSRFGGDPRALGAVLRLDGAGYEVVGILPPGFEWGRAYRTERTGDLWAPLPLTRDEVDESRRGNENLDVYARLRPEVSLDQAQADLDAVVEALRSRHPRRYTVASGFRLRAVPLQEDRVGALRPGLLLVFLAVVALLLTAAANVAGLLLARSVSRRHETAVRAALGASPSRLAREVLAEAALLAGVAGLLGIGLAFGLCAVLDSIDATVLPRSRPIALSPLVAAFAVLATVAVAAVSGLLPAWQVSRRDLAGRSRGALGEREAARARRVLIVAQTALAAALLAGAGLLVRSLAELQRVEPGFRTDGVLASRVRLPQSAYAERSRRARFADEVLARVAEGPDVQAAAVMSEAPLSGSRNSGTFAIEGQPTAPGENQPHAELWSASAGYFATMGVPLRRGRLFGAGDGPAAVPVAIVSEALARRYFAGADPVGRRIDFQGGPSQPAWREIVGVVGDVRHHRPDREPGPQLYVPFAQRPTFGFSILVRSGGDPRTAVPVVREAVRAADAALPLYDVAPLARLAEDTTRERRAARSVLAGFAAAALLLSALGLYGLLAQSVRERVPEIGLRMAIGAGRSDVLRMILASGGRLLLAGLAAGLLLALATGRLLRGYLFGVTPADTVTYAVVALVLLAAGLGASAVPAWRASRVDPLAALRAE
jgi:putative ABC transport system permease protein